jgi:hypothetical protein
MHMAAQSAEAAGRPLPASWALKRLEPGNQIGTLVPVPNMAIPLVRCAWAWVALQFFDIGWEVIGTANTVRGATPQMN